MDMFCNFMLQRKLISQDTHEEIDFRIQKKQKWTNYDGTDESTADVLYCQQKIKLLLGSVVNPLHTWLKADFQNLLFGCIWKNHTCEEGGAHLRISVWHLLMNLKNNYLSKNLLKWANKKCKNFNIYNVAFL